MADHHDPHPDAFDGRWWEQHYQQGEMAPESEPTPYVKAAVADRAAGTALDAGCGTGADARWLAEQGWQVAAVDISATAIEQARRRETGPGSVDWLVADIGTFAPGRSFDLVISQYVHPHGPFSAFVHHVAELVAPAGTLLIVGHEHSDEHSSTHAPRDASIATAGVTEVLDPATWRVEVAEVRNRTLGHGGKSLIDTVVRARRRP